MASLSCNSFNKCWPQAWHFLAWIKGKHQDEKWTSYWTVQIKLIQPGSHIASNSHHWYQMTVLYLYYVVWVWTDQGFQVWSCNWNVHFGTFCPIITPCYHESEVEKKKFVLHSFVKQIIFIRPVTLWYLSYQQILQFSAKWILVAQKVVFSNPCI